MVILSVVQIVNECTPVGRFFIGIFGSEVLVSGDFDPENFHRSDAEIVLNYCGLEW